LELDDSEAEAVAGEAWIGSLLGVEGGDSNSSPMSSSSSSTVSTKMDLPCSVVLKMPGDEELDCWLLEDGVLAKDEHG
jgi:hypothetical protein